MDELEELILHTRCAHLLKLQRSLDSAPLALCLRSTERLAIGGKTTEEELGIVVTRQCETRKGCLHVCLEPAAIAIRQRLCTGISRIIIERRRNVSIKLMELSLVNAEIHHPLCIAKELDPQTRLLCFERCELVEHLRLLRRAAGIEDNDIRLRGTELLGEDIVAAVHIRDAITDILTSQTCTQAKSETALVGGLVVTVDKNGMTRRE